MHGSGAGRPPILSCRQMSKTRRLALFGLPVALFSLGVLDACSSSSTADTPDTGPIGCPPDPFVVDGIDKIKTDRLAACNRYVAALNAKAEALHCGFITPPTCPKVIEDFEASFRAGYPGVCIDGYSVGSLANCECRIATYTSCADFSAAGKLCKLAVIQDDVTKKCEADAGADADALSPLDDAPGDAGGGG